MFQAITRFGITRRLLEAGRCHLKLWNLRDFAKNSYRSIDDRPYGGGPGMVLSPQPLEDALLAAKTRQNECAGITPKVVYLSPQGRQLSHASVEALSKEKGIVILCGRYEGIDERILKRHVTEEISIGDYVLSGGELAAMVLIDAMVRKWPGSLHSPISAQEESFEDDLLDCPHYTRPENFRGSCAPAILLSGNHAAIKQWRLKQALGRTWHRRPDLLARRRLTEEESALLADFQKSFHSPTTMEHCHDAFD